MRVGKLVDERGGLVGALVVRPDEDVMVITSSGKLVQVNASDVRPTARNTMGVIFARPDEGDRIIAITRNPESGDDEESETPRGRLPPPVKTPPSGEDSPHRRRRRGQHHREVNNDHGTRVGLVP